MYEVNIDVQSSGIVVLQVLSDSDSGPPTGFWINQWIDP